MRLMKNGSVMRKMKKFRVLSGRRATQNAAG